MQSVTRTILMLAALAMPATLWAQQAPAPAAPVAADAKPAGPPANFVAPAEPKPDETNAQRGKSQPGNNAPFWRDVRDSGDKQGYTSLPGAEKGMLIQPFVQFPGSRLTTAGEAWRQVRNNWIIPYGGSLILIVVLAIALFYWRKGPLGGHVADTGRKIERFTPFERAAHWTNAIAFVVLAVSGLVMAFGKFFLLPVIGATLVRLAELCAEDVAQLRRSAVRGVAAGRDRDLRARQPAARGRPGVAGQGRRLARWRRRCRRTASMPARRSSSGWACSCSG